MYQRGGDKYDQEKVAGEAVKECCRQNRDQHYDSCDIPYSLIECHAQFYVYDAVLNEQLTHRG